MKGHYLMIVLPDGKANIRREYLRLAKVDETADEALDRWVRGKLNGRKRNLAKAEANVRAQVIETRLCRPTSWHREQCEREGVAFPRPTGTRRRRRAA